MAKNSKVFLKLSKTQFFIILALSLLVLFFAVIAARYSVVEKKNRYLVENKYYGFELKTPESWVAEGMTRYSEENVAQVLEECKNDKSPEPSSYEIGRFRFESQRYPQGFGDMGYFPTGFSSGAILDITVNCIPESAKIKIADYSYGNLEIGGEKALEGALNLLGFGKTKYFSVPHNNFQYRVSEYVFISPENKGQQPGSSEEKLRGNYEKLLDGVISSFKFIK